jgi:hypothetical protein
MSLDIIRRVVARFRSAKTIPIGKTVVVNDTIRIHRYSDHLQVTDLTNAGKRGKRVQQMNFSCNYRPERLDEISESLLRLNNYSQVETYAQEVKADQKEVLGRPEEVRISENALRGVDVEPAGEVFNFKNPHDLDIQVSPYDFMVNHHAPLRLKEGQKTPIYQDTLYTPDNKKDAVVFYAWVKDGNRFKLNGMTIADLRKLWDSLGVNYDSH